MARKTMRGSGRRPSHPGEAGPPMGLGAPAAKPKKGKAEAVTGKGMPKGLATSKAGGAGPDY